MVSKNNKILKGLARSLGVGVKLNFLNKTKFKISKSFFEKAFFMSIKTLKIPQPTLLELYLVSRNEIKEINSKWRGKKLPTDVISFEITNKNIGPYSKISNKKDGVDYLDPSFWGIIFLCPDFIKTHIKKYSPAHCDINVMRTKNTTYKARRSNMRSVDLQCAGLLWAFIHGIIHCMGYDHEKSPKEEKLMRQLEKQILNKKSF